MRPEKASIVEDLVSNLQKSPFLIITDYHGLKVDQFSDLRTRLAGVGARYTVVKNTFLNRASRELGYPDLTDSTNGQTAIVTGDKDVSAAAKVLAHVCQRIQETRRQGGRRGELAVHRQADRRAGGPALQGSAPGATPRPAPDSGDDVAAHAQRARPLDGQPAPGFRREAGRFRRKLHRSSEAATGGSRRPPDFKNFRRERPIATGGLPKNKPK